MSKFKKTHTHENSQFIINLSPNDWNKQVKIIIDTPKLELELDLTVIYNPNYFTKQRLLNESSSRLVNVNETNFYVSYPQKLNIDKTNFYVSYPLKLKVNPLELVEELDTPWDTDDMRQQTTIARLEKHNYHKQLLEQIPKINHTYYS